MKLNLHYDGLRSLATDDERRTALFKGINAALLSLPILCAAFGPQQMAKATAHHTAQVSGPAPKIDVDNVKAFLTSDRAVPILGQKWAVPSDNPALADRASRIVEFFAENVGDIDTGYQVLFDEVPGMLGGTQDSFELVGAYMGFTWDQLAPGAQIKPRRDINESVTPVKYATYGDGFSLLDEWLQYGKYYRVSDAVNEFLSTQADTKAQRHYGLITGLGAGINVAYATDDTTTFNKAVAGILRKSEKKGYALGGNTQVDILVSPENVGRVLAMLDARRGSPMIAFGTQKQPIAFGVRNVIVSTKVADSTNGYYVVLPGRKLKRADWMLLKIESKRDPSVAAEDWYGRAQYNAIVGDQDQVARVLFA